MKQLWSLNAAFATYHDVSSMQIFMMSIQNAKTFIFSNLPDSLQVFQLYSWVFVRKLDLNIKNELLKNLRKYIKIEETIRLDSI